MMHAAGLDQVVVDELGLSCGGGAVFAFLTLDGDSILIWGKG